MFTEEFNQMIKQADRIAEIPLSDIKLLAERYPYCQTIQSLLTRKLYLMDSPLLDQQVRKAAVMAYDREQLYHYVHKPIEQEALAEVETQSITLPPAPIAEPPAAEITPVEEAAIPQDEPVAITDEPAISGEELADQEAEAILQEMIESIPEITHQQETEIAPIEDVLQEEQIDAEAMLQEETFEAALQQEPVVEQIEEQIAPAIEEDAFDFELPAYDIERELGVLAEDDKFTIPSIPPEVVAEENEEVYTETFTGWLSRLGGSPSGKVVEQKASNAPVRVYLRKQPAPGEHPASGARDRLMNEQFAAELARKSLIADDRLVSETYARILVMQGKYSKAIDMYQRLSLLKPQKSDYFAALIDQIKKR